MIVNLNVWKVSASESSQGYWTADSAQIMINTNMIELQNTPVEFYSDTKEGIINQVIALLKVRGMSGKLRINKN